MSKKMLSSYGAEWCQRCRRNICRRCALPQALTFLKYLVAVEGTVINAYFYHQTRTYHLQPSRAGLQESSTNRIQFRC